MSTTNHDDPTGATRRSFLKASSAAAAAAVAVTGTAASAQAPEAQPHPAGRARGADELRVALVGCGGRGTGAAAQALSTSGAVRLVAVADAFEDRLTGCLDYLTEIHGDLVDVPEERRFVGFDAYQRAIDSDVDVVILTTPPGFRPMHFEYAVKKNRHIFMEKPVAVDGPGVRAVLAAADEAKSKNLKVGVGLQRHHDPKYQETVARLRDGAIGDIVFMRCYWNSSGVWTRPREAGMSEMEYQMRNWYYFNWLCGDHIVEQHIHNLDVCNWVKGGPPVMAQGQGGRQVRVGDDTGEIFDHHMVEFTYADGTKMLSQCRHIKGCWSSVSEHAHGSRGTADIGAGRLESSGGWTWRYDKEDVNPYQVEHDVLFAAIRDGKDHNEAELGAHSTMTSVLGRMATYSGRPVSWDEALASDVRLAPTAYAWDGQPPSLPDANGRYPIAVPGVTRVV